MASARSQCSWFADHLAQRHVAAHEEERRPGGVAAGELQRVDGAVGLEPARDLEAVVELQPAAKPSSMLSLA